MVQGRRKKLGVLEDRRQKKRRVEGEKIRS
jgi:hypothetical protein